MPSRIVHHETHGPLEAAVRGFKDPETNNVACALLQLVSAPLLATRMLDLQNPASRRLGRLSYLGLFLSIPTTLTAGGQPRREVNLALSCSRLWMPRYCCVDA